MYQWDKVGERWWDLKKWLKKKEGLLCKVVAWLTNKNRTFEE
jgi:hypothetical protein